MGSAFATKLKFRRVTKQMPKNQSTRVDVAGARRQTIESIQQPPIGPAKVKTQQIVRL